MQSKSVFIQIFAFISVLTTVLLVSLHEVSAEKLSETANIQLLQSKALVFAAQGNYSDAVDILQSAIEQEPSNYQLIFTCAKFAQKSKNIPLALELYQNLYEKVPNLYSTRLELAELLLASGEYEKALIIITQLTHKPIEYKSTQNQGFETLQTFRAHLYRGMAHYYKQQYEESKKYLVQF